MRDIGEDAQRQARVHMHGVLFIQDSVKSRASGLCSYALRQLQLNFLCVEAILFSTKRQIFPQRIFLPTPSLIIVRKIRNAHDAIHNRNMSANSM